MKETITNKIEEFLHTNPNGFQIVEEQIDIDLQFEYFNVSKKEKKSVDTETVLEEMPKLFDSSTDDEERKVLLVKLATLDNVEALRTIEKYAQNAVGTMKDWAYLAKKESKLIIESSLLDEKQILISTGLGGKGAMLRYFIVLISKEGKALSDTQQKVVKNEFEYVLSKNKSVLESITFESKYSQLLSLIPLDVSIQQTLKKALDECNGFGDFLESNFLVTNVKVLSLEEIEQFLNDSKKEDTFVDPEDEI